MTSSSSELDVWTKDIFQYFKSLIMKETPFENAKISDILQNFETNRTDSSFKELDDPITQDEIK